MRFEAMRTVAAAVLAGALASAGGPALAADPAPDRAATPEEVARVEAELTRHQFSQVHDVEIDDGVLEADATSPDGQEVEVKLDPNTFQILSVTPD